MKRTIERLAILIVLVAITAACDTRMYGEDDPENWDASQLHSYRLYNRMPPSEPSYQPPPAPAVAWPYSWE